MKQLIECVPNISEGRDMNIINQVTAEIEKVEGVKLLTLTRVRLQTVPSSLLSESLKTCAKPHSAW